MNPMKVVQAKATVSGLRDYLEDLHRQQRETLYELARLERFFHHPMQREALHREQEKRGKLIDCIILMCALYTACHVTIGKRKG